MAPLEGALFPMLLQLHGAAASKSLDETFARLVPTIRQQQCAEAFRNFEVRIREQHPRSAVYFVLLDNERIAASCDGEFIFGDMRHDPVTNSAMVHHRDHETGAPSVSTL